MALLVHTDVCLDCGGSGQIQRWRRANQRKAHFDLCDTCHGTGVAPLDTIVPLRP
jgi:DnaJ-class molecular chaperone